MKRAGRLYSKILYWDNLLAAFYKAAKNKRRSPAVLSYEKNLYGNLKGLQQGLVRGDVPLGPYRFFTIHDPRERLICVAPFSNRVLHHAVMNLCEPVFESFQIADSYACRRGRGRGHPGSGEGQKLFAG